MPHTQTRLIDTHTFFDFFEILKFFEFLKFFVLVFEFSLYFDNNSSNASFTVYMEQKKTLGTLTIRNCTQLHNNEKIRPITSH